MSKQLAVSAAFSTLMMAAYVLFGGDSTRVSLDRAARTESPIQVSAPALPRPDALLPSLR
jgi:hypothetical protein